MDLPAMTAAPAPTLTREAVKAWALALPEPPTVRIILYALADHLDSASGIACVPHNTLAQACRVTKLTVLRTLAACTEKGYISTERHRRPDGRNAANSYRFPLALPLYL